MAWHAGMLACHLYLTGMAWHGMAWHGMFWVDGWRIESTKTRVNPGFFRGTPPGKPGFVPRFLPTPRFFPQYSGGGHAREFRGGTPEFWGKFGNSSMHTECDLFFNVFALKKDLTFFSIFLH